jgi:hypothetical protein
MGQTCGIYDDAGSFLARFMDPIDKHTFMVALPEIDAEAVLGGARLATALDVRERFRAIDMRLTLSQKVQIGAVEDVDRFHLCRDRKFGMSYSPCGGRPEKHLIEIVKCPMSDQKKKAAGFSGLFDLRGNIA